MDDSERVFIGGNRNPNPFGWSLRWSAGAFSDPRALVEAAVLLGRPAFMVDESGYECEIFAAAINQTTRAVAYVESRAKEVGFLPGGFIPRHVDVSIKIHLDDLAGAHRAVDIESYNPFFGCEVRCFEWIGQSAFLIYREKHDTFACHFGDTWPPNFVKIEDRWALTGSVLSYIGYKEDIVKRCSVPDLRELPPISIAEAKADGTVPPDDEAYCRIQPA